MSLSPGSRLGAYEVLAEIGAGGMGEVYRARDSRLARDVAIKGIPRRDDFEDPHELAKLAATVRRSLQDFRREFEYLVANEPPPLQVNEQGERQLTPDDSDPSR